MSAGVLLPPNFYADADNSYQQGKKDAAAGKSPSPPSDYGKEELRDYYEGYGEKRVSKLDAAVACADQISREDAEESVYDVFYLNTRGKTKYVTVRAKSDTEAFRKAKEKVDGSKFSLTMTAELRSKQ